MKLASIFNSLRDAVSFRIITSNALGFSTPREKLVSNAHANPRQKRIRSLACTDPAPPHTHASWKIVHAKEDTAFDKIAS